MTHEAIAEIDEELVRDRAALEQALQKRQHLLADRTPCGFRAAAIGITLRFDIHRLTENIFRNKCRLVDAKRRSEQEYDSGGWRNASIQERA
jgi:hypothetical protein